MMSNSGSVLIYTDKRVTNDSGNNILTAVVYRIIVTLRYPMFSSRKETIASSYIGIGLYSYCIGSSVLAGLTAVPNKNGQRKVRRP